MSGFDAIASARALLTERSLGKKMTPLALAPRNESEAATVQFAVATLTGHSLPAGFKIGATAQRMQAYLGLSGPAAGFMAEPGIHQPVAGQTIELPFAAFLNPGVECEIVVKLGHDLPAGSCTPAQATAAVAEFTAGIEIVENRYEDISQFGTPSLIADQVFHAACIRGSAMPDTDWQSLDIPALAGRMSLDGEIQMEGLAGDLLGHPMNCLAWLAASPVAAAFGGLKAGQIIMLGSVTPPLWLTRPGIITVDFSPLPIVRLKFS
jgi:2-keto-4-pentenoate hydratase